MMHSFAVVQDLPNQASQYESGRAFIVFLGWAVLTGMKSECERVAKNINETLDFHVKSFAADTLEEAARFDDSDEPFLTADVREFLTDRATEIRKTIA